MAKVQVKIGGMSCSFCAETLRKSVTRVAGVEKVSVSLAHEEALVEFSPEQATEAQIKDAIRSVGYTVRDPTKVRTFEEEEAELARERDRLIIAASFTWISFVLMLLMWVGRPLPAMRWLMPALAVGTVFGPGLYILRMALPSIRRGIFNQHVLLEFGAFAGLFGGVLGFFRRDFPVPDFFAVAVFITTYHVLSGYASLFVRTRASQAVRKLMELQPPTARVIRDGHEKEVPIEEVRRGELVRIRPGEAIPVDGEVAEGASAVDESLVTGEAIPKEKVPGDEVIGGSMNQSGTLVVRVTKVGEESFLQQVSRHIQEARALKPGIIQLVDRVLKFYVPGVLAIAGFALLIWVAGAWLVTGQPDWPRAMFAALAVLVMGYPCALGMATPLAMIRGGGEAARKGILMRSGEAFQVFKDIKKIILDKTGTITIGKPRVLDVFAVNGDEREALRLAASAEAPSEHPLARAIVDRARAQAIELAPADEFEAVAGRGIRARVDDTAVQVGSLRFLREEGVDLHPAQAQVRAWEEEAKTVVGVAAAGRLVGLFGIADEIKEDAAQAVSRLRRLGIEPVMITGDNERTALAVAEKVGITEVFAQVLPQNKAAMVRTFQERGYRVAMVGDGINDAPALMQADVGIAIGAGTDIAMESSDIVIVGDRLGAVVDAYHIGRSSFTKTVQNLALAFSFNGIGVPAAVTGLVHPIWAMIAMVLSVSTVLVNSFGGRLLPRAQRRARSAPEKPARITVKVPSMHCQGCVANVQEVIRRVPGVVSVDADLQTKLVTVAIQDGAVEREAICAAVSSIGHVCGEE
jgi:heavy metal translocating P-type ATPase